MFVIKMLGFRSTLYTSSACKEEGEIGVETTIIVIVGLYYSCCGGRVV